MIGSLCGNHDHIEYLAEHLRKEDAEELRAGLGLSPYEGLIESISRTTEWHVLTSDGFPMLAYGYTKTHRGLDGRLLYSPWALGTDEVLRYKLTLTRYARWVAETWMKRCALMVNYVYAGNETHVNWLKVIGFEVDDPEPIGVDGALFHPFWMRRQS